MRDENGQTSKSNDNLKAAWADAYAFVFQKSGSLTIRYTFAVLDKEGRIAIKYTLKEYEKMNMNTNLYSDNDPENPQTTSGWNKYMPSGDPISYSPSKESAVIYVTYTTDHLAEKDLHLAGASNYTRWCIRCGTATGNSCAAHTCTPRDRGCGCVPACGRGATWCLSPSVCGRHAAAAGRRCAYQGRHTQVHAHLHDISAAQNLDVSGS